MAEYRREGCALAIDLILAWADAHKERTGRWPSSGSGFIHDVPGETWSAVHYALPHGNRDLPRGYTLHSLLVKRRGKVGRHRRLLCLSVE